MSKLGCPIKSCCLHHNFDLRVEGFVEYRQCLWNGYKHIVGQDRLC